MVEKIILDVGVFFDFSRAQNLGGRLKKWDTHHETYSVRLLSLLQLVE